MFFAVTTPRRRRCSLLLLCAAALIAMRDAPAFTFTDGTTTRCTARGGAVAEIAAPADHPVVVRGRIAITEPAGSGYRIIWNEAQLKTLPPEMHEATRSPWQAPWASGATQQIARKAPSLRVSAQWPQLRCCAACE